MRYIAGSSEDINGQIVAKWFEEKTKNKTYAPYSAIGFYKEKLEAAVIFTDYNGANIEIHIYGPKCLTRYTISVCLDYVFNQLKCVRLTAKPRRENKYLLKILSKFGLEYEATLKQYYGETRGKDAIVYRLTKEKAKKWIEINA